MLNKGARVALEQNSELLEAPLKTFFEAFRSRRLKIFESIPLKYSDILERLDRWSVSAKGYDSKLEEIGRVEENHPILKIRMGGKRPKRALLSAGIHGDEPAGVLAILQLLEQSLLAPYLENWELIVLPCLNPYGIEHNTRNNADDIDLNRQFKLENPCPAVKLAQSIYDSPFQLTLELHEDVDSHGYYLYQKSQENDKNKDLGRKIVREIAPIMPVNLHEEIDGLPAGDGVIDRLKNPDEMDFWPMALYSFHKRTSCCFTLETGTDFPMQQRVDSHCTAVLTALKEFQN